MSDESRFFTDLSAHFADHQTVKHSAGEYVRLDDRTIDFNTIAIYFSVLRRGRKGTYQHCAEKHLHHYLAEFDFRHNDRIAVGVNDLERTDKLGKGVVGKRLTSRTIGKWV